MSAKTEKDDRQKLYFLASGGYPDTDIKAGNWQSLYPFAMRSIQVGEHRINFVDEGDPSADPILMVHGNPTWSFYWRRLISQLSESHRTIAIDHLGCGLSDKPVDHDYCLQDHIDNLCQLIDRLDLSNVTLMAHDWGGSIGLGSLLARRDRFRRIVLFNTGAFPPPYIPLRIRACRWPVVGKIGVQGLNMFARAAITMATEQAGGLPDDVAAGLLAPYHSWNHRTAIYRFVKDIPAAPTHRTWDVLENIESQLPQLSTWPILMMWGMKDWCFRPECLRRLQKAWPEAEVHEIDDAGHYVIEDAPEQVASSVAEFLERTDA